PPPAVMNVKPETSDVLPRCVEFRRVLFRAPALLVSVSTLTSRAAFATVTVSADSVAVVFATSIVLPAPLAVSASVPLRLVVKFEIGRASCREREAVSVVLRARGIKDQVVDT